MHLESVSGEPDQYSPPEEGLRAMMIFDFLVRRALEGRGWMYLSKSIIGASASQKVSVNFDKALQALIAPTDHLAVMEGHDAVEGMGIGIEDERQEFVVAGPEANLCKL